MHFLNNSATHEQLVETAFVYHDIGLWSDHKLAYLEPSEALAVADNEAHSWGLDPEATSRCHPLASQDFPLHRTESGNHRGLPKSGLDRCNERQVAKGIEQSRGCKCRSGIPQFGLPRHALTSCKRLRRFDAGWRLEGNAGYREVVRTPQLQIGCMHFSASTCCECTKNCQVYVFR